MTTVLTKFDMLARLTKDGLHETWIGKNREPDYDQLPIVHATSFPREVASSPGVDSVLDYELTLAKQLKHPNIETTFAAGKESGVVWFIKDINSRESLRDFFDELRRRGYETLTIPLAISLATVTAEALHHAHTAKNAAGWSLKVVHGGIDFHTISLSYEGNVVIQDFGVAKGLRQAHLNNVALMAIDRIAYMSPEEVRGRPAEPRSDVFSLAVVLWELLTGRRLFEGGDVAKAICEQPIQPPSAYNAKVTPGLDSIVLRALERRPDDRFQNAEHMAVALRKLASDPSKALERVPRIMSQLFPKRLERWKSLEAKSRSGDFSGAADVAMSLFQTSDATVDATNQDHAAALRAKQGLPKTAESHTDRIDGNMVAQFAQDVDAALGVLEGEPNPVGAGWDAAPIGAAADKLAGMWDDPVAEEPTVQTSAEEVSRLMEAAGSDDDRTVMTSAPLDNPNETTLPHDVPDLRWADDDLAQTLPTGTPSLETRMEDAERAETNVTPNPMFEEAPAALGVGEDPAVTHAAYKPQPMPETAEEVPDGFEDDLAETQPPAEPAPQVAPEPAPVPAAAAPAPEPQKFMPEFLPLDEDDEDEEPFFEPFPIDVIVEPPELAPKESNTKPVLEIIRTAADAPLDITVIRGLGRYKRPGSSFSATKSGGSATLKFKKPVQGWVRLANTPKENLGDRDKLSLKPGDAVEFEEDGLKYYVRFFRPPQPPSRDQRFITPQQLKIYGIAFAISLVLHGLGMLGALLTSYLGVELTVQRAEEVEVFAEGKLDKPKPKKKPKPKPKKKKPKPKKLSEKKPVDPTEAKAKIPKSVRKQLDKRLRNKSTKNEDKADRLMAALTTPQKGEGKTIKDVVTNIDAVAKPGASNAAFNVTGTLGALEGGKVNIARDPGGSKIGDIGGSVDGGTGKLKARKKSGKVRGKARGVKALAKVQGTLSRSQVWEVIQGSMGKIQRCYEKELNKNPSLGGKLTFEWTVKTNGRVGAVKEKGNSLGSSKVSKCVSGVIKKMKFPRPKGGEVIIKFPFIFKSG